MPQRAGTNLTQHLLTWQHSLCWLGLAHMLRGFLELELGSFPVMKSWFATTARDHKQSVLIECWEMFGVWI